jgi:hypothetical protein
MVIVRGTLVGLMLGLGLLGCGPQPAQGGSTPGDSGVQGVVVTGPSCPLGSTVSECPAEPVQTDVQVLEAPSPAGSDAGREAGAGGKIVSVAHSDSNGRFRVNLAPGSYVLQAVPPSDSTLLAKPTPVEVKAHEFTRATVVLDTGIR